MVTCECMYVHEHALYIIWRKKNVLQEGLDLTAGAIDPSAARASMGPTRV